ncbi:MAG: hypothetical protein GY760_27190, partial [Deltaproteobacteria bacterium]|nr:hypothetical protein [Deltaproteobacteria bacterium]
MKTELKKVIVSNIGRIIDQKAEYVDVRFHEDDNSETICLYDGDLEINDTVFERGLGVRVLYGGAWGFAATSNLLNINGCFDQAYINAVTASKLIKIPLTMGKRDGHISSYSSPVKTDPFEVKLDTKLDFLFKLDEQLKADFVKQRRIDTTFQKKNVHIFNSEGTEINRNLTNTFATMQIKGMDKDNEMQSRSKYMFTSGKGTRGFEMLIQPELFSSNADRIKSELSSLLAADSLNFEERSVILLPGQGFLQVHETIGHPLELDRILGYELSYAGGS